MRKDGPHHQPGRDTAGRYLLAKRSSGSEEGLQPAWVLDVTFAIATNPHMLRGEVMDQDVQKVVESHIHQLVLPVLHNDNMAKLQQWTKNFARHTGNGIPLNW
ncbi:hypothetical protein WJX72_005267 [[Myrmecia] bisecta]|uniref:Uncharacterized protein n=1 Tax=[Myrmecia] bisecta TaxID=41462 RepID=A0AAW1R7E4_9CHLO